MLQRPTTESAIAGSSEERLHELRHKHPRLVYDSFNVERTGGGLRLRYQFRLEPDIGFKAEGFAPETIIQADTAVLEDALEDAPGLIENLAFHLGLVEMLSYWKAACAPTIEVRAGALSAEQCSWWENLLLKGMGEYFYVNRIDFRQPGFVRIASIGAATVRERGRSPAAEARGRGETPLADACGSDRGPEMSRDLVLVSGGKDTVVTIETLKAAARKFDCLLLNPTQAALDITRQVGCERPILVRRTIDPRLLELNAAGYLNGHTPFSALLAFLGVTVAALCGHRRVIVSNERSAEEATVEYLGQPVNHQYSKTFQFERAFRSYASEYLSPQIEYFSLLRPLYELQIARQFARYPQYFPLFRSCNRGQATNSWCGRCAKCLFVWTVLYPFIERERMLGIFGSDPFANKDASDVLRALLGLDAAKPFECVGTREETLAALHLCAQRYHAQGTALPAGLQTVQESVLSGRTDLTQLARRILFSWSEQHFLPPDLAADLRRSFSW